MTHFDRCIMSAEGTFTDSTCSSCTKNGKYMYNELKTALDNMFTVTISLIRSECRTSILMIWSHMICTFWQEASLSCFGPPLYIIIYRCVYSYVPNCWPRNWDAPLRTGLNCVGGYFKISENILEWAVSDNRDRKSNLA